ncbi:MAG: dipicolinate synthase subunit B [Clostridium sp.]|nr:dipicolinate synthase subunit B [Clostridium sp.]MCM1548226.1 dipicolinate synthase subunit B [Ruminococcus sp.]
MADFSELRIGYAMTGSFCTFKESFSQAELLKKNGADLVPIMSYNASAINSRFGTAEENIKKLENICKRKVITTIDAAEPIGPKNMTDILVVCPCTGNTCAKLAMSITDSPVTMAVKSHLRNKRPVVIALASNDSLAGSMKNIGALLNMRNYYFVPFYQDDKVNKPTSAICDFTLLEATIVSALEGRQLQPILC